MSSRRQWTATNLPTLSTQIAQTRGRAQARQAVTADIHYNLGLELSMRGKMGEAVLRYWYALILNPDHAGAHNNLGSILCALGRSDAALFHYRRAATLEPADADIHYNLANLLVERNPEDAIVHYERALALNPGHAAAHNNLGILLSMHGKLDAALLHYDLAIALRPDDAQAHFNRSALRTFCPGDAGLEALKSLAGRNDLPADKIPYIHFALAKALEDCGDHKTAFEHLVKGNDLKRAQIHYDAPCIAKFGKRVAAVFGRGLFDRFHGAGDPSSVPVFVVGMPRSGSTLIEQILASHPKVHGAGEFRGLENASACHVPGADGERIDFPECIPLLDDAALRRMGEAYIASLPALADGKVRIINKVPQNFFYIGLIRLILPDAKIIHTVRDPVDTCVSCYSRLFASGQKFSYNLTELGSYYRCYRETMAHWRSVLPPDAILDVVYEDVVNDVEGQTRLLLDYCGLSWDERCLSFHKTRRPVRTASAVQVRQPLFRSSIGRWQTYKEYLQPLLAEISASIGDKTSAVH